MRSSQKLRPRNRADPDRKPSLSPGGSLLLLSLSPTPYRAPSTTPPRQPGTSAAPQGLPRQWSALVLHLSPPSATAPRPARPRLLVSPLAVPPAPGSPLCRTLPTNPGPSGAAPSGLCP